VPSRGGNLGLLGGAIALGSLFVVSSGFTASTFDVLEQDPAVVCCQAGWSDLQMRAGAWFKVLAHDSAAAAAAVRAAWESARSALLELGLPPVRRF
jgi:hypothetical protein